MSMAKNISKLTMDGMYACIRYIMELCGTVNKVIGWFIHVSEPIWCKPKNLVKHLKAT